ncbi:DnaJ protein, putative [Plasmodium chabaudi chabaudi]|uniref:DnaJ protein, putative n=1 Tax=Plasmodium chabaudi chabaudi TaxID=31271 RepID=A0A1C6XF25_PLACU|nr:DnaJ protein, putative [Plasmodium chabaudi chabaudi]
MDTSFIPKELVGKDIYKILGLSINCSNKPDIKNIIRKRYLKCALLLHPDKNKQNKKSKEDEKEGTSGEEFSTLKCAYEFLMNETLRNKYNSYIQKQKTTAARKKNATINNISLNRYLDKKKFVAFQNEKLIYKQKLEQREKAKQNTSSFPFEEKDIKEQKENDLSNIKKQNESFIKKHNKKKSSTKSGSKNDNGENIIEIYLNDYNNNIDILKLYIKNKFFLTFFINFNFRKYNLNLNEEQKHAERKVGYIIFPDRSETIKAFLYYKKNIDKINTNVKLRLLIPCSEHKETHDKKEKEKEETKQNVDNMMDEMMDELDKVFSF